MPLWIRKQSETISKKKEEEDRKEETMEPQEESGQEESGRDVRKVHMNIEVVVRYMQEGSEREVVCTGKLPSDTFEK